MDNKWNGIRFQAWKDVNGKRSFKRSIAWITFYVIIVILLLFVRKILNEAIVTDAGLVFGDIPKELFDFLKYLMGITVIPYTVSLIRDGIRDGMNGKNSDKGEIDGR